MLLPCLQPRIDCSGFCTVHLLRSSLAILNQLQRYYTLFIMHSFYFDLGLPSFDLGFPCLELLFLFGIGGAGFPSCLAFLAATAGRLVLRPPG